MTPVKGLRLRPAEDTDSPHIAEIVAACYALYPGCVFDLEGELPALKAVARHYNACNGGVLVAEAEGCILGNIAWVPGPAGIREVQLLYVDPAAQGRGIGRRLLDAAIAEAEGAGASAVELWTDTRFAAAHRLYERRGFRRAAMPRSLGDRSHSVEFRYRLALRAPENGMSPKREK